MGLRYETIWFLHIKNGAKMSNFNVFGLSKLLIYMKNPLEAYFLQIKGRFNNLMKRTYAVN